MRILIDNDLIYKRNIALSPEAISIIQDYFQPFKEMSVGYEFKHYEDNFEIIVRAQKITLLEEDMAIIHEVLEFFWQTELRLFEFSLSGYSFKLTSAGEQDIDFNVSKEI